MINPDEISSGSTDQKFEDMSELYISSSELFTDFSHLGVESSSPETFGSNSYT